MTKKVGFLLLTIVDACFGQTPTGTIQGVVSDSTGAVVPGCRVLITNTGTNEAKEPRTDGSGRYVQPFLPPGTYTVRVEREGFRPVRQDNVKLDVGQNRSADFRLELGAISQEVQVTAAPPPLDTNNSSIGQVIENKRLFGEWKPDPAYFPVPERPGLGLRLSDEFLREYSVEIDKAERNSHL